jgi:phage regulator Rha-like protein
MNKNDIILIDENVIKNKIYYIREQYVMIDSQLAEIYGYTTKRFNEQVKNNIERFDLDFMFQLSDEEVIELSRSNFSTTIQTKGVKGGRVYKPYAFTEQGIYMLMTILKGEKAVEQSKQLIRIFKKMKDYLSNNNLFDMVIKHDSEIDSINNDLRDIKNIIYPKDELYFYKEWDAYSKLIDIFSSAKSELIIVDRYTDKSILDIICRLNVKVILITGVNTKISKLDIEKYNSTYNNLLIYYDDSFHDRYFILDRDIIYHSGNSINHIGYRKSSIDIIGDDSIKNLILSDIEKIIC